MPKEPIDLFELRGDAESLPDAFFDALAGLLLEIDAVHEAGKFEGRGEEGDRQ